MEKREKLDLLVLLDTLVDQEIRETKELKEEMGHLEVKEKGERMAYKGKEVQQAQEVSVEGLEDAEALA